MNDRVVVGRIVKPHGIRGEVVVNPLSDRPERFAPGDVLTAGDRDLVVIASRPHKGRLLVAFENVPDRTAAERLRGRELATSDVVEQGETYLASELVGARVRHEDGRDLGAVSALIELPPAAEYDLLEVERDDGTTWLLPAAEYVEVVEEEDGSITILLIAPPEGLVDDGGPREDG